ncbi:hypothetical protein [Halobaculum sp. D14]|uniref:hypothetical protein n=1 Tax=Halobaculum sp. D14 TaxID=3421642 RepID=UPI003EB82A03
MSDVPEFSGDSGFEDALTRLIERAYRNGTNIEGGWKCSIDGNGNLHWDVQISRVEYDDD